MNRDLILGRFAPDAALAPLRFFVSSDEDVFVDEEVLDKVGELTLAWEDAKSAEIGGWFTRVLDSQYTAPPERGGVAQRPPIASIFDSSL